jgi:hypothetical protein
VKVGGSVVGGGGEKSGSLFAETAGGEIKSVAITGDVRGGSGSGSALIHAGQKLGVVTLGGSLIGSGERSAIINAGSATNVASTMKSVFIGGDVRGGAGAASGNLGSAFGVAGSQASLDIGSVTVKGSVFGSAGQSAAITASNVQTLTVGGSFFGGSGESSASVVAIRTITTATIGGSVTGDGAASGRINTQMLGTLTVGRDVRGGAGDFSGQVLVGIGGANAITVGGSVESGTGLGAGSVIVNAPLVSLTIKGGVLGTAADPVFIVARGRDSQSNPLALGTLSIGGSAEFLEVLGGFSNSAQLRNADANLGTITVGGAWRAGSITAGVEKGADGQFGTFDDALGTLGDDPVNRSKIAAIIIKGRALGTAAGGDAFGFVAQEIGSLKIGASSLPMQPGARNDDLDADDPLYVLSRAGDLRVHEEPA